MDPRWVLKRLVQSERSLDLQRRLNRYTFEVDPRATKGQVREAVEEMFGVDVLRVRTLRNHPKLRRRGRFAGYTAERKKAIVSLPAGQTITVEAKK